MDFAAVQTACTATSGSCQTACTPTSSCNPITNAGCGAGSVCDAAGDGTYSCFPTTGTAVSLCGSCDGQTTICGPGLECLFGGNGTGQCAQYCCSNADCGAAGFCDTTLTGGMGGGLCTLASPDGGVSDAAAQDATAQDAGGGITGPSLVCSGVPTTPPSGGSCVTFSPDAGM